MGMALENHAAVGAGTRWAAAIPLSKLRQRWPLRIRLEPGSCSLIGHSLGTVEAEATLAAED